MILFVGDKPSKRMKPGAKPFEGAACEKRLNEWITELTLFQKDSYFRIINQSDYEDDYELRFTASKGFYQLPVIALGSVAANRLSRLDIPHFKLPHPSGRNRQINNKKFIAKKLRECKKWLEEQK